MFIRFIKSAFGRLFFLFFVISTIAIIAISKSQWDQLVDETYLKMSGIQTMVQKSATDRFSQQEAMFKILGQRLLEAGGLNNTEKTQQIMDGLLKDNPVFMAYGIAAPDGQLKVISINLRNKKLPNLLQSTRSSDTFKVALASDHLTLGRTYYFDTLKQ